MTASATADIRTALRTGSAFSESPVTVRGPIIVGTDGTDASEPGIAAAHTLAHALGASVQLVSVVEPMHVLVPSPSGTPMPSLEDRRAAEHQLQIVREQLVYAGGDPGWTAEIKFGDPATVLTRLAKSRGAQLIVMGKRAHGRVDQLLGDDTVFDVIRLAETPVLVAKGSMPETPRVMTVAVDFSELSSAAARTAFRMFPSAGLAYLVHVRPRGDGLGHLAAQYATSAASRFDELIDELDPHTGARIDTVELDGVPAREIVDFAETSRSDLLVVGSYRRGLFRRLAGGAMASRLMRFASCPVLIVPEASIEDIVEEEGADTAGVIRHEAISATLDELTRRNAGRRVMFEADTAGTGAQLLAFDYAFLAASMDVVTGKARLVFGDDQAEMTQAFTHTVAEPADIDIRKDIDGRDHVVRLSGTSGQATLTFW
jgi:nucleotide-binding universal stress UspA family protein